MPFEIGTFSVTLFAVCAPVYGLLCIRDVSIPQSNGELRKMVSPYKSPSFRPFRLI